MGENVHVNPRATSPEPELPQDGTGSSLSLSHWGLSRSLATGAPPTERGGSRSFTPVQHQPNALGSTPMSSVPSDSHGVRLPHPHDQRRTAIPDLQYPNIAPDNNGWPSFEQSGPMDQDSLPLHQPSMTRNFAVASIHGAAGSSNSVTDSPILPSPSTLPQSSRSLAPTESEQLRRPVEHLIKLASVREERMSKQREIFDLRSGELSTFSSDALRATKIVQDEIDLVKLQAEEMRAQAGQMLQEANKTRELADRLIASVETLTVDVPIARTHVDHMVERSEQMSNFMRKNFDLLAALRIREQARVEAIQEEFAEQARMQELQRELERRKEAQEKAARREEEEREAAKKKAEEEDQAARKKAEEEDEVARKKLYDAQRAAVMEKKRRYNEQHAESIQAERERERRVAGASGSGSNPSPIVFPGVASEHANNARVSTSLPLPPVVPGSTCPPARGKGSVEAAVPPSQPPSSPNKARTVPAPVWFVPAQTEVGRTVNTDLPLSSTILASELHTRIVDPPRRPPSNHLAHPPAPDQILRQEPKRMTPRLEQRRVEIKREPSVEELPAKRLRASPSRASPEMANTDDGRQQHLAISRRTPSQDRNGDQRNQASSRPESRANSLYGAQTEEHRRRSDPSAPVPLEQASLIRSRDSLYGRAAQATDVRDHISQGSTSSDRSAPRWNDRDRHSRSPVLRRPLSRSASPYTRKRDRSGTPPQDSRPVPDYWRPPPRSQWRSRSDWAPTAGDRDRGRDRDRDRQYYEHDREGQGDSPRRYRPLPTRRTADTYRPSHSPAPPSPQQYRYELSPRPGYRERSPSPEYETQRFVGPDARDRGSERINTNSRRYEPTYEADVRRTAEKEQQQGWQRPTPSPSDRDRTPTPPPRLAEAEVGLLDRIDMNKAEDRGRGRGRLLPGATRGGANLRRGLRGGLGGSRGRGVSGSTPALLTRMTGSTIRGIRPAHAPSLSDRMQQD